MDGKSRVMFCLGLAGLLGGVAACASAPTMAAVLGSPHGLKHFKKLEGYNVALELVRQEAVFQAGR